MVSPNYSNVDGKVWSNNQETREHYRLDVATGKYENLGISKDPRGKKISGYGMPVDKDNNVFMLEFSGTSVGRRDAKTGLVTIWPTPTAGSRPRRGRVDENNNLWFTEFAGNAIAMLDPKEAKFKEWVLPNKYDWPYDVVATKNGEAWTGSMFTDLVTRLDPKSGEMVQYLLPRSTNIRRVFVDETAAAGVLGGQQQRRLDRQGRAAGLNETRKRNGRACPGHFLFFELAAPLRGPPPKEMRPWTQSMLRRRQTGRRQCA